MLVSLHVFGNSLFYTPPLEEDGKKYEIIQNSYMETLYGDSNTKRGSEFLPFHRFQKGRLNARSVIEVKDTESHYSALLDVQIGSDVNEDQSTMFYINRGYIELQNAKQPIKTKVRIGVQDTALGSLSVNSSTVMKNGQGVNGGWYRFAQMPVINSSGGYNPTFLLQSTPMSSQGFTDGTFLFSQNSGNLNFVQPSPMWSSSNVGLGFFLDRTYGFKFAMSYQPSQNTGNFGINANGGYDRRGIQLNSHGNQMFTKDLTSFVLNYLNEFNGIAINASVGYETASYRKNSTVNIDRHTLSQYTAGLNLSYLGLTIGGSYSNAGDSTLLKHNAGQVNSFSTRNANLISATSGTDLYNISQTSNILDFQNTYNYDFGISYAIAQFQAGIAHQSSNFADNKFNITLVSLSEDLKSSTRIKLTAMYELGFYQFNSANYFDATANVHQGPQVKGLMGSIGLRVSI